MRKRKKMDTNFLDEIQEPVMGLLGIGLPFMALFIIYKAIQLKNRERMALIEQGMDPSLAEHKPDNTQNSHKNGIILIGIAIGIITGYILNQAFNVPDFVAYSSPILLFCGVLLIIFHKRDIAG